ncbi:MAG: M3 family oligoendopeptidase [Candidatus Riflebacteria bacterium]|nr:M3 family oligoendopeptidase [Candidatus Riflebacteria bacterium]
MSKSSTTGSTSAAGIRWNLGDYYKSPKDPAIERDLKQALEQALAFEKKYRGIFTKKPPVSGKMLASLAKDYEAVCALRDRPHYYAHLLHAEDSQNPAYGSLLQQMQQRSTEISKHLIFVNLEWCAVDEKTAKKLLADPACARYRHYLEAARRYKPHQMTEPEEKIVDEMANTGSRAFSRLFDQMQGAGKFTVNLKGKDREMSKEVALNLLYDPDREVRKAAADGLTAGFEQMVKPLTFIFNTLVTEHATIDRLRSFPDPMASRNLGNEIDGRTVEALLETCDANYPLVARYYRLKAKLLGLKTLYDYDRYAPLAGGLPKCTWKEARALVSASYHSFSPLVGKIVDEFFQKDWIDAELRDGKRSGAFSCSGPVEVHPYILMNYTDSMRDVSTLAHELGHGVHQYLARKQGYLQCDTPLTVAETASVFGEMLTFHRLLDIQKDPKVKLALLCAKIEEAFATVFRQACMTRFEQQVHASLRKDGELPTEKINALWMEANKAMFGDSVKLTDGYAFWWSYIGHFIHSPFYCYAYSFGELLVLSLYSLYRSEGKAFVPKYVELLTAGGSESPETLVRRVGLDIAKKSFWKKGIDLIAEMVQEAEGLAAKLAAGPRKAKA